MHLRISSAKWCPFCLCLNVLNVRACLNNHTTEEIIVLERMVLGIVPVRRQSITENERSLKLTTLIFTVDIEGKLQCFQHTPRLSPCWPFCFRDSAVFRTASECKTVRMRPGGRFNMKMTSYQYRKSHCGDKTFLLPSYLHSGISYNGKMTSLYWIRALSISGNYQHQTSTITNCV